MPLRSNRHRRASIVVATPGVATIPGHRRCWSAAGFLRVQPPPSLVSAGDCCVQSSCCDGMEWSFAHHSSFNAVRWRCSGATLAGFEGRGDIAMARCTSLPPLTFSAIEAKASMEVLVKYGVVKVLVG